jgi:predicted nucleic acid-binding Zn ribbon protein
MPQMNELDQLLDDHSVEYPEDRDLAAMFYILGWKAAMQSKEVGKAEEIAEHEKLGI